MFYKDKIIKGEAKFKAFMEKFRPSQRVEFCETIGHCGEIDVEMFYEKGPSDDGYRDFYWLRMPSRDDTGFCDITGRRQQIYEDIRAGKILG